MFSGFVSIADFSVSTQVAGEPTLHRVHSFQCVKVCFMARNGVCLGECSLRAREEGVLCCCWVECSINVRASWLVGLFGSTLPEFSACLAASDWEGAELFIGHSVCACPLFHVVLNVVASCVSHSVVRCLCFKDDCVFLENWLLYYHIFPLFVPDIVPSSESVYIKWT